MSKIIMVTGGTGYIGSWIVKYLLEKGYTVRLTVRDKSREEKYKYLLVLAEQSNGKLEIWEANLLEAGSFDKAASGADAIIHVASPFKLRFRDAQKDLLDPALMGTRNVLSAATKSGTVKKVVLTSSVAAVHGDNIDMNDNGLEEFTEDHFNTTSSVDHQPYSYSKAIAEKEAWKMSKLQDQWRLVVINPSFVIGPALFPATDSESFVQITNVLKGKMFPGAPDLHFGFVDVRDVAVAHILALEKETSGRFILAERTMNFLEFSKIIKKIYGSKYKVPVMVAPKFLFLLIAPMFGVTRKFVKRNVGYPIRLNTLRSKTNLGLTYRSIEETVKDMVESMHQHNMI
jgi:nucleoside-diphosphate-sugar epimerase